MFYVCLSFLVVGLYHRSQIMKLEEYRKMSLERAEAAIQEGLSEYKKSLEGPFGGSKLPNGIPVGRITGDLRQKAYLEGQAPSWSIRNRASYWKFLRDGTRNVIGRGKAINEKVLARIRQEFRRGN